MQVAYEEIETDKNSVTVVSIIRMTILTSADEPDPLCKSPYSHSKLLLEHYSHTYYRGKHPRHNLDLRRNQHRRRLRQPPSHVPALPTIHPTPQDRQKLTRKKLSLLSQLRQKAQSQYHVPSSGLQFQYRRVRDTGVCV